MQDINYLWNADNEQFWQEALAYYPKFVDAKHVNIENELAHLDVKAVKKMNVQEFYEFLYDKYFFWKYTAYNRLATTRRNLKKYQTEKCMYQLDFIHKQIFMCDLQNIKQCLEIAVQIKGLGIAGASGLLSLMFPEYFGTVDQFAIYALSKVMNLPERDIVASMNPQNIKVKDGVILIGIYRSKAQELNIKFETNFWTPRKIDQVLWCIGR